MKTVSVNPKNKHGHRSEHGYIEGYSYDNREEDLPDERSTCDDQDGEPPGKTAVIRHRFFFVGQQKAVREVIISGGNPFTLSTHRLESHIARIRKIKYAAAIRTDTRFPLMLPQRIDNELSIIMLSRYGPIWPDTHFNHVLEIISETAEACDCLLRSGVTVNNQSVLLHGINDSIEAQTKPFRAYLNNRVPFRVRRSSKCG